MVDEIDVAIIGGGPAGLQAALVLARTRKRIIVFDSPEPPRNGASHGVHNFVGLDGLRPAEIREQAWQQINVYNSVERRTEMVVDIKPHGDRNFVVQGNLGSSLIARQVILAIGFRDVYPAVEGYRACWGNTIFTCPFCDGYENRDRVWGLVVSTQRALEHMPTLYKHWTSRAKIILSPTITLSDDHHAKLLADGLSIHMGKITQVHHVTGEVHAITLDTGEVVDVGTLMWPPVEGRLPLTEQIIKTFKLDLDEQGYISVDPNLHQTSYQGLWAVGDILGWATALGAAFQGARAAYTICSGWYTRHS